MNHSAKITVHTKKSNDVIGIIKDRCPDDATVSMKAFTENRKLDNITVSILYKPFAKSVENYLDIVLPVLEQKDIEYSVSWSDNVDDHEKHFRSNDGEEQCLSWTSKSYKMVNIEDVREAIITGGETAIFELSDRVEKQFEILPWND